jgi:hypothetical protein
MRNEVFDVNENMTLDIDILTKNSNPYPSKALALTEN